MQIGLQDGWTPSGRESKKKSRNRDRAHPESLVLRVKAAVFLALSSPIPELPSAIMLPHSGLLEKVLQKLRRIILQCFRVRFVIIMPALHRGCIRRKKVPAKETFHMPIAENHVVKHPAAMPLTIGGIDRLPNRIVGYRE